MLLIWSTPRPRLQDPPCSHFTWTVPVAWAFWKAAPSLTPWCLHALQRWRGRSKQLLACFAALWQSECMRSRSEALHQPGEGAWDTSGVFLPFIPNPGLADSERRAPPPAHLQHLPKTQQVRTPRLQFLTDKRPADPISLVPCEGQSSLRLSFPGCADGLITHHPPGVAPAQ